MFYITRKYGWRFSPGRTFFKGRTRPLIKVWLWERSCRSKRQAPNNLRLICLSAKCIWIGWIVKGCYKWRTIWNFLTVRKWPKPLDWIEICNSYCKKLWKEIYFLVAWITQTFQKILKVWSFTTCQVITYWREPW